MHGVYETLQREGKIGPFEMRDGQLVPKPFAEYPKWVTKADGKRVIVKTLAEEIAMAGQRADAPNDPLAEERAKVGEEARKFETAAAELEELKAQMKAQLAELETARQGLQGQVAQQPAPQAPSQAAPPSAPTKTKAPAVAKAE